MEKEPARIILEKYPARSLGWNGAGTALMTFLALAALAALAISMLAPPAAVSANASPTEFASGRAMEHLKAIARQPHAMGTAEHQTVRQYIVDTLNGMGVRGEVQQASISRSVMPNVVRAGTVSNILARLPGTASSRAILLVAHYDSVLSGPGANDDGAAVAAMLETLRALRAGPRLQNDVIFLFTDGEEAGMLGAQAFAAEHPWAKDAGLVLNFEARGGNGPALMFETSPENGWLIQEFASAATHPFASSLFYDVYQYLPNDSDFTIFKGAGIPGFNFAYIDDFTVYHSPLDTLANVSERSLQHHGTYALALTRHFGYRNLNEARAADSIYFDLFGATLIHYPRWLALPLMMLVIVVFAAVLRVGFHSRQLTVRGIVLGSVIFLLNIILAAVLAMPFPFLMANTHGEFAYYGTSYNGNLYLGALLALIVAATAALQIRLSRSVRVQNLAAGALVWWLVLAALTSTLLPGGSYLFVWPLLFSLIGLGLALRSKDQEHDLAQHAPTLLLCAIPAIVLFAPLIYLLYIALTMQLGFVVAIVAMLLLGPLIPHLSLMTRPQRWLLPGASAVLAIALLVAGSLPATPSPDQPLLNDVMYTLDADTGSAMWASSASEPDAWVSQYLGGHATRSILPAFFPRSAQEWWQGAAPSLALRPPEMAVLEDTTAGDVRTLRLRITSARQAPLVWVYADPQTEVLDALVDAKPTRDRRNALSTGTPGSALAGWTLQYSALPKAGMELTLKIAARHPVSLRVIDRTDGLPNIPGTSLAPRSDMMRSTPSLGVVGYSNATLVGKSFRF